jgi:hypothetical protein
MGHGSPLRYWKREGEEGSEGEIGSGKGKG